MSGPANHWGYSNIIRDSALLPIRGVELLVIGMGDRGSKSDSLISVKDISVKEQRVDGSSVFIIL